MLIWREKIRSLTSLIRAHSSPDRCLLQPPHVPVRKDVRLYDVAPHELDIVLHLVDGQEGLNE